MHLLPNLVEAYATAWVKRFPGISNATHTARQIAPKV